MVAFYRDVVGLEQHSDHGDLITFDVRPGLRLNIGRHSQIRTEESLDPFRMMLNLGVDDIHAVHARMVDNGAEFIRPAGAGGVGRLDRDVQGPGREYVAVDGAVTALRLSVRDRGWLAWWGKSPRSGLV